MEFTVTEDMISAIIAFMCGDALDAKLCLTVTKMTY